MLSNFNFGTNWWGVGNEEGGTVNLSSLIRDEEEKDLEGNVQDLDELADRLLTQFPPYGTNHSLVGSQQDADWLLSEEDDDEEDIKNIPTQEELHNANRHPGLVPVSLPVAPAPSSNPKNCLPLPPSATMTDWDYDEQFLWKPEAGREEQKHNEHYYRRTGSTNTGSSFLGIEAINNTSYLSQTGKQQWMYGRNSTNFQQQQPGDTNNTNATATNVDSTSLVLSPTQKMKKEQQQKQQQSKNSNINPNEASNTHFQNSNSNNTARDFYNSRQHWMPDQLCKHCYACDTPFTVFRRRHVGIQSCWLLI